MYSSALSLSDEEDKKSIPGRVFFNHFKAIRYHIDSDSGNLDFDKINFFNKSCIKRESVNLDSIKKLLWNSWSTEYALHATSKIDSIEYYKFALHWNFPQAYYATYLNMSAFHETRGLSKENHTSSIKEFGTSVLHGHYPKALNFYCQGDKDTSTFHNLSLVDNEERSVLENIECVEDAQKQIATFLKTTRKMLAEDKKEKLIKNKNKDFLTSKGQPLRAFRKEHWDKVYNSVPCTTIMNLLYRLRIKANYHDIETFINAKVDFKEFHQNLCFIVDYMNTVHEAYIAKCIGKTDYEIILEEFKGHISEEFALKRYVNNIKKFL